jgi:uncharacterized protein YcgL (UPF0745 family)
MLCQLYKSPRQAEMYLYVELSVGLEHVPPPLLARFGEPEKLMVLQLDEKRKLARVEASEVRRQIRDQGYFLQMPPTTAQLLAAYSARD